MSAHEEREPRPGFFEWEVLGEEQRLEPADEPSRAGRPSLPRRLVPLLLLFALLLAAAVVGARRLAGQRDARMRADLVSFIESEERARAFGQREEVTSLLAPGAASPAWQSAYARTFTPQSESSEVEVLVQQIRMEPGGAEVTVSLNGATQRRYYRLGALGWGRAPLPAGSLGEAREFALPGDVILRFQEADRAFASELAEELPELRARVLAWGLDFPERVDISPGELARRGAWMEGERLQVASPTLYLGTGPWSVEESIRLDLASVLLGVRPPVNPLAEGSVEERLLVAGRNVTIARWALAPESFSTVRGGWALVTAESGLSPFVEDFVSPRPPGRLDGLTAREAGAHLVADTVLTLDGADAMIRLLSASPSLPIETRIQRQLGRSLGALATEVRAMAEHGEDGARRAHTQGKGPAGLIPPLRGHVSRGVDGRFRLQIEGASEHPVLVLGALQFEIAPGETAPAICAPLVAEVEVDGQFLSDVPAEAGGPWLQVSSLRLPSLRPALAMADVALPVDAASHIVHLNEGVLRLLALDRSDRVVEYGRFRGVEPLTFAETFRMWSPRVRDLLVLRQTIDGCPLSWLYQLRIDRPAVSAWLTLPALDGILGSVLSSQEREDLLIIMGDNRSRPWTLLDPNGDRVVGPRGQFASMTALGWLPGGQELLRYEWNQVRLERIRLDGQVVDTISIPTGDVFLLPGGQELLYVEREGISLEEWRVRRASLGDDARQTLLEGPGGQVFQSVALPADPTDRRALVQVANLSRQANIPDGLMLLDVDGGGEPVVVAEQGAGVALGPYLLCGGKQVLYVQSGTRLYRWHPDQGRDLLVSGAGTLIPWGCRSAG